MATFDLNYVISTEVLDKMNELQYVLDQKRKRELKNKLEKLTEKYVRKSSKLIEEIEGLNKEEDNEETTSRHPMLPPEGASVNAGGRRFASHVDVRTGEEVYS